MARRWRGGPRSRRSYTMDYHRKAKSERRKKKKGHVRPHYRRKKKGGYTKIQWHKRRSPRRKGR